MGWLAKLFPTRQQLDDRAQWYASRIAWNNKNEFKTLLQSSDPSHTITKNHIEWTLVDNLQEGFPDSLATINPKRVGFEYAFQCTGFHSSHQIYFCKSQQMLMPYAKLIQLHYYDDQLVAAELRLIDDWQYRAKKLWSIPIKGLSTKDGFRDEAGNCIFVHDKMSPTMVLVFNRSLLEKLVNNQN
ncbi:MAG: hypothetical protein ACK417_06275 [Bacteroidia bacterium]